MIAALYKSRLDGTQPSMFSQGKDAHPFGWEVIEGLLDRELKRAQIGQMCRVPGLKENFVYRDSWTRLNVKPAKIMQVCCKQSNYVVYCIKACINLVLHMHTHARTHTHTHTHTYAHTHAHAHIRTHTHTHPATVCDC